MVCIAFGENEKKNLVRMMSYEQKPALGKRRRQQQNANVLLNEARLHQRARAPEDRWLHPPRVRELGLQHLEELFEPHRQNQHHGGSWAKVVLVPLTGLGLSA